MTSLDEIKRKNILVIGDAMLDTYYEGNVGRISPEAPVPVFRKKTERHVPGGAANVALNLMAAGQNVYFAAVIGNDQKGQVLKKLLGEKNVNLSLLLCTEQDTTEKVRFVAENGQQVMRLDIEEARPVSQTEAEQILMRLRETIDIFDLIVISDYNKGMMTDTVTQEVIALANECGIKVLVDVKSTNPQKYEGAFLLKPNLKELHDLTGMDTDSNVKIRKAMEYLRETTRCEYILTTCGAAGMMLQGSDKEYFVDTMAKEVYDVTGAGDTVIAYLAAGLANQIPIERAVWIANYAAGLQVAKSGTSAVYLDEIKQGLKEATSNVHHKILGFDEASALREKYKDKRIVFTNGCFDILHVGHVKYLQEAAQLGDLLVLGLNSDDSVKRLKGDSRPINNQKNRAEVLSALDCIDYIVVFDEDTPYELIQKVNPDVLVKGGDYLPDEVVGKDIVEARGGRVELLTYVEGISTSALIQKLKVQ